LPDFQASSTVQGANFERQCNEVFASHGFVLHGRYVVRSVGVEIDQCAERPDFGVILIEYKGSTNGKRPGLLRTDTMKKAIANGALIKDRKGDLQYWVITSHLPESGSSLAMMRESLSLGYVDRFIHINQLPAVLQDQEVR
jgi:hypothetical protein